MARISNTTGIKNIGGNQFELIVAAAHRARSYSADNQPLVSHFAKRGMTALREIEANVIDIQANRDGMIEKYTTVKKETVADEDN